MTLSVEDLTKSFGAFTALAGVSFTAQEGEFVALLGPSGSGKTTLLRVIAGLELADSGRVRFRDADLLAQKVRDRGIGFVFQHYALFRHMTAAENVAFGLRAKPRRARPPEARIRARVEELLTLVQLEGLGGRYPAQLSGGQRQRVALARALAIEPRLLLLDEPFGALDAKVRRDLRRWLKGLHRQTGLTTLFVTHDQEEALELADRVALLNRGALEQIGPPEALYNAPATPFVFEFLGDSVRLPCAVEDGVAHFGGVAAPILGGAPLAQGAAIAFARPSDFTLGPADGAGLPGQVRGVLRAGPEARVDAALDTGERLELRLPHAMVADLAPGARVTLAPLSVRVWPV